MEKLLNTLIPEKCAICGRYGAAVCYTCLHKCKIAETACCIICEHPSICGVTHRFCGKTPDYLFSCFKYEGIVREIIRMSKYGNGIYGAIRALTQHGLYYAKACDFFPQGYLVVPIPISKEKLKRRGFNQSEIIAKELGNGFGLACDTMVLVRHKDTTPQHEMTRQQRLKNMAGAFEVHGESLAGKDVLLVDDICTTGATFIAAAEVLKSAGARKIGCFSLARTMPAIAI